VSGSTGVAQAAALAPARKRWTLVAVVLGSGIVFLDTSVVNLALPKIGEDLASRLFGTLEAQSYVANSYFVTLSALLILAGALSDYYGRRRMFAIGLAGFAGTSLLCGIAPTMEFLIVCRTLQGAAAPCWYQDRWRSSPPRSVERSRDGRSACGLARPPRRRSWARSSAACS
jgi:predicted MFS family arabinose efflux permease